MQKRFSFLQPKFEILRKIEFLKILIIEPYSSGHHMSLYLKHYFRAMSHIGWSVTILTTSEAKNSNAFALAAEEFKKRRLHVEVMEDVSQVIYSGFFARIYAQFKWWFILKWNVKRIREQVDFDVVFLPSMDYVMKSMSVFGSPFGDIPFCGFFFQARHHLQSCGFRDKWIARKVQKKIFSRCLSIPTFKKIFSIDHTFIHFAKKAHKTEASKLQFVSDFSEISGDLTKAECRDLLDIDKSAIVVLVYGSLTPRKSVKSLLLALRNINAERQILVLLAGKPNDEFLEEFNETIFELPELNNFINSRFFVHTSSDEYMAFQASDIVWIAYSSSFSGSSGVLFQAAYQGLPVIGSKHGLIGYTVTYNNIGVTCNPEDITDVTKTLESLVNDQQLVRKLGESSKKFGETNSPLSHISTVLKVLES